ncbi:hypothetical protein KBD34_05890 [Patescibacteria group bacterium]|nr:hypothetical protein [Patescibacteria group bacterium]
MSFSRQPRDRRSFGQNHATKPFGHQNNAQRTPPAPTTPIVPPRRKPLPEGLIETICYENDVLKPKPDCRAALIDYCILEDDFDIDEAEDAVDKALRERNLWNEPRLEDILYGDDTGAAPSTDSPLSPTGDLGA